MNGRVFADTAVRLIIVKAIALMHGSDVLVRREEGGNTFGLFCRFDTDVLKMNFLFRQ